MNVASGAEVERLTCNYRIEKLYWIELLLYDSDAFIELKWDYGAHEKELLSKEKIIQATRYFMGRAPAGAGSGYPLQVLAQHFRGLYHNYLAPGFPLLSLTRLYDC